MKRLQIVFYGDPNGYPPIINAARSLCEAGWLIDILCREESTHAPAHWPTGTSIRRIGGGSPHPWREFVRFVLDARRLGDRHAVIAGHDMHGLVAAAAIARHAKVPYVYHCHDFTEASRRLPFGSRIVKWLEPPLARAARLVIAPDEGRAAVIRESLRLAAAPLVVPNAPRRIQRPATGRLKSVIAGLGVSLDRIVFRQGRIGPGHAIEATIRSMPMWDNGRSGFIVMGPADPSYANRLRLLARELGVDHRFHILPPVGYDDVATFTVDADVGHALYEPINVNHAEMGTASNKALEYMAAGVPSLVPDTESFRRLLTRAEFGIAVDASSAEAIARAVNRLLGDPGLGPRLVASGRRLFEDELHYDRHAPVLEKALGNAGPQL